MEQHEHERQILFCLRSATCLLDVTVTLAIHYHIRYQLHPFHFVIFKFKDLVTKQQPTSGHIGYDSPSLKTLPTLKIWTRVLAPVSNSNSLGKEIVTTRVDCSCMFKPLHIETCRVHDRTKHVFFILSTIPPYKASPLTRVYLLLVTGHLMLIYMLIRH